MITVTHNHDGAIVAIELHGTRYSPEALSQLIARVATLEAENERLRVAETTVRDARFVLASAFQEGQKPLDCPRLRDVARRTFQVLRRVP